MLIIFVLILVLMFLINYGIYWILYLKNPDQNNKFWKLYTKVYLFFWGFPLICIPILSSSFLSPLFGTPSYFREYWIWFLIIGIIFLGTTFKLAKETLEINKNRGLSKGKYPLITKGPYEIMRHPMYSAWALCYIGLAFVFDSLMALLIAPFFILFLILESYLEEKYLLIPQFGEKYINYMKKTLNRLFPPPYNTLLFIIALFVVYIGILNFPYIF